MEIIFLIVILVLLVICILLIYLFRPQGQESQADTGSRFDILDRSLSRIETNLKEDFRVQREENAVISRDNRYELSNGLHEFRKEMLENLRIMSEQNQRSLEQVNKTLEEKVNALIEKTGQNNRSNREDLTKGLKDFSDLFDKNVKSFNDLQREKFGQLEQRQTEMVQSTEKSLEQMRETVEEKLQKTLNERIGQSFELVRVQLESVQKGLGEMQSLAQDVGGLKKVLSNVKVRGGIGEMQLSMLLEQVLAPEQYESNVKTKQGSPDMVEFAIRLPGRDDNGQIVYLPIDAKFPKDSYEKLVEAYDIADPALIDEASKNMENTIRKMAKDIRDKYLDPPNTTDFGIMFLPFEGIYAEVIRRSSLLEQLQQEFKVIVTGPTTLAAILNSLQMGFRTLALQKRSSEVWQILGAVKTEFKKFGGLLDKVQKNLNAASTQLEEVVGKRTRAIHRSLKGVEALPASESQKLLPELHELDDDGGEKDSGQEN